MKPDDYIDRLNTRFKTGISTEHTYRGDLQNLIESISDDVLVTNEPARIACGSPDYILTKGNIPVGYIEAKDIGADLKSKIYKEQFDRYRRSLTNLIITDYLNFQLFREGQFVTSISIGEIKRRRILGLPQNYSAFTDLMKDFCTHVGETIKSASKLSKMMAGKARLLADIIEKALYPVPDRIIGQDNTLHDQFNSFKKILIHDISEKEFADIYAQTIAYGMFAARLHDRTLEDFSRQEAAELIPKSNPFLRKLFQYIAGYDLDDRIKWIVDALADIFRATNVAELLKDFGKTAQQNDPIIHFYETFLSEYDPKLRKSRGVWYTPEPVVNFIVRAVDDILKADFALSQGIADASKIKIKVDVQGRKVEQEVHKVQILDPAAGTGTFLAQVIRHIYRQFEGQQGIWSSYVEEHLIPRLNGFEILMASYAMAHLKLDLLLSETGYKPEKQQRFRVFLTNSLEEHHPDTGTLFAAWLSAEANEANYIKRDTPVMVVLGNPPYSGESQNKGEWIMNLMEDYKREPGGKEKLNEKNPKWINDDYVKFIRYGQHFIEKNGSGVLAFINPHGFLDNPTFRGMRWNLLKTFDKIYTIDLHGNAKKKETAPDGSADQNVFDIMQGVSINLFIKTGDKKKSELGKIFHYDLYGKREIKYDFLWENSLKDVDYKKFSCIEPSYLFVQKELNYLKQDYDTGFRINDLFFVNGVGITTAHDEFVIDNDKNMLLQRYNNFKNSEANIDKLHNIFNVKKKIGWDILDGWRNLQNEVDLTKFIKPIAYRPFDNKYIFYENKLVWRIVYKVMQHFLKAENVGLMTCRQIAIDSWDHIWITERIADDSSLSNRTKERAYIFPLYLYPEPDQLTSSVKQPRQPNLNMEIVQQIAEKLNLTFTREKDVSTGSRSKGTFAPIDILDYIYAVLHSPTYRKKYKEFLKIDFPRVPYPKNIEIFWQTVKFGGELRHIHLLESPVVEKRISDYPQSGNNIVEKPRFENGRVWINKEQYFDNVPETAWDFYIGGYQPAQKWLKDRKGRELNFDDILHYQKIIAALSETDKTMGKIDQIDFM